MKKRLFHTKRLDFTGFFQFFVVLRGGFLPAPQPHQNFCNLLELLEVFSLVQIRFQSLPK